MTFWKKARVYYTLSISRGGGPGPRPPPPGFATALVYNRFYIVYDYNHYNIVYDNQCSIYSGAKVSISNFECPPFELFYHCGGISLLYIHICLLRYVQIQFIFFPHEQLKFISVKHLSLLL